MAVTNTPKLAALLQQIEAENTLQSPNSAENLALVAALVEEYKILGYDNVNEEQKRPLTITLDALYADINNPQSRKQIFDLLEQMSTQPEGTPPYGYDLSAHLQKLSPLLNSAKEQEFYLAQLDNGEQIDNSLNIDKLWSTRRPLDAARAEQYMPEVEKIFEQLKNANGAINRRLKQLAEECPISFDFAAGAARDGKCQIVEEGGKRRCVIGIYEGALKDKKYLPMLMSHELGHYLDMAMRPKDCGNLPEGQELVADMLGAEMALNAGFSPRFFAEELQKFDNPLLQKRGKNLDSFAQIYAKAELDRRLEELPNTPAGRKMKAFVHETDSFFDRWQEENSALDDMIVAMPEERKIEYVHLKKLDTDGQDISNVELQEQLGRRALQYQSDQLQYRGEDLPLAECYNKVVNNIVRGYLLKRAAAVKINERFNPDYNEDLNAGYCAASLMSCLQKADRNGELGALFAIDKENLAHPADLFKSIQEMENGKYAAHIYASEPKGGKSIHDVIKEHDLKPGALVCLTMDKEDTVDLEGKHNHLMLYTGRDRNGNCRFTGFNDDIRDGALRNHCTGYVCDTLALTEDLQKDYHRNYTRGRQGSENAESQPIKLSEAAKLRLQKEACDAKNGR